MSIQTITYREGIHRYVIISEDRPATEVLQALHRWVSDPRLSFAWADMMEVEDGMKQAEVVRRKLALAGVLR